MIYREGERATFQTTSLFAVPTIHGWCEQNMTCVDTLGEAARVAHDITAKAFTNTSTDGRNATWASNELSESLQTHVIRFHMHGRMGEH